MENKFSQEINIKENLENIIKNNAFSNAYIFYGPDNVGKKESAFMFIAEIIKKINCDFQVYAQLKENNYPDFLLIEPTYLLKGKLINQSGLTLENKQKTKPIIRIEQIRNIKEFISKKSIQSDRKFILIDDAHLLNESSSNCLLKTLEEPTNAIFILLTSRFNLLLDTIVSRCQLIRFKPYSKRELKQYLDDLKLNPNENLVDHKILDNLILLSNGSPGKLFNNLKIWNSIPLNIRNSIKSPLKDYEEIFFLAKNISLELDIYQQEFLIEYIQRDWWNLTRDKKITEILEGIKINLNNNIQSRLSWEAGLLKVNLID